MDSDPTRPGMPRRDTGSSTGLNALIGAVAGVLLAFVPFSPFLGGIVAGYLEGGEPREGVVVGTIAGLVLFLPFILFGSFLVVVLLSVGSSTATIVFGLLLLFVLVIAATYTVAFGAVGGFLGVYVRREL